MDYKISDIGSFIQLEKGATVFLKRINGQLSGVVNWDINQMYGTGKLQFSTPAILLAINEEKNTIEVRLPFSENTEYVVQLDAL
jgi:hypothetical protein